VAHRAEVRRSKCGLPRTGAGTLWGVYALIGRGTFSSGLLAAIRFREDLHAILANAYAKEPFVHVLPFGQMPQTRHVRGSNMTFIGVAKDRVPERAIVISALDNLVKGASGQAVQNMNLMLGYPEATGLEQIALFP
jgi:N-acetyl-gamma-glutamylphosphate reductase